MQRETYFDNAKLLFIFFVVFGHLIQPMKGNFELADALYQWIYIFHIPAFVLISGFFASGANSPNYLKKLTKKLLLPYLLFQLIYNLVYVFISAGSYNSLYDPHWTLWFLLSLFSWHILLIWFKKIPAILGITLAFLIGSLIGFMPLIGHEFSLSRTFVFFPFFLMGYWISKNQLYQFKNMKYQFVAIGFLAVLLVISYLKPMIPVDLMFGSQSYVAMDMLTTGIISRLALYGLSVLMVFSVLILIPRKRFSFTHLGQYTLYVYLLHGVLIQIIRNEELLQLNQNLDIIPLAVISGAMVWFLSSKWVLTFTQPLIEGKATRLQECLDGRGNKLTYRREKPD
ncbi:acyltransferase family protein [Piscibacillus halophilus]|uniref:Fucose 4-O-acetylase n=1 Tax=Piscibacillus halophilus TaxID=571933 RepID=A0A1H9KRJ7_9BACI|nr:acyltransferase family protein [Piscibacillus halophilus]SER01669.1 Fucose 4-O-acetylase [Piscibacillus halophilus]